MPRFWFVPIMDHELHVTTWGDPSRPALVLWHGLARTGRDFDELAAALSDRYFVLCPDMIGRGLSSWSDNPEAEYSIEYACGIAVDLLDYFSVEKTSWLGTSMGGLIGMRMASGPLVERLSCLIVNDIGPEIPQEAIDRILAYAQTQPVFRTLRDAEVWFRAAYTPFGPASDGFWERMARASVRRRDEGTFTTHYDPRITIQFTASAAELTSWDRFERITLPMHVIHGEVSDILPADVLARMRTARPDLGMTQIDGAGHAPSLSRAEDIALVEGLLDSLQRVSRSLTLPPSQRSPPRP